MLPMIFNVVVSISLVFRMVCEGRLAVSDTTVTGLDVACRAAVRVVCSLACDDTNVSATMELPVACVNGIKTPYATFTQFPFKRRPSLTASSRRTAAAVTDVTSIMLASTLSMPLAMPSSKATATEGSVAKPSISAALSLTSMSRVPTNSVTSYSVVVVVRVVLVDVRLVQVRLVEVLVAVSVVVPVSVTVADGVIDVVVEAVTVVVPVYVVVVDVAVALLVVVDAVVVLVALLVVVCVADVVTEVVLVDVDEIVVLVVVVVAVVVVPVVVVAVVVVRGTGVVVDDDRRLGASVLRRLGGSPLPVTSAACASGMCASSASSPEQPSPVCLQHHAFLSSVQSRAQLAKPATQL
mmetsp:Transcript_29291/g.84927  ORF Transcript_29291/g.84927 Transcript_29291/m.84927 type:complete len:352 (-) Transcript_29291:1255-2310(-)